MNPCASVKRLMEIKDVTEEDAKLIRAVWKAGHVSTVIEKYPQAYSIWSPDKKITLGKLKRTCIDRILHTYGVEYLGELKRKRQDGVGFIKYCNTGDTYAATVVFIGSRLVVNCWGHYVENKLIYGPEKRWDRYN
jgi:hypothetical protein